MFHSFRRGAANSCLINLNKEQSFVELCQTHIQIRYGNGCPGKDEVNRNMDRPIIRFH
jgi:hypothetical protein